MLKIYHNPRCGKSRYALQVVTESEQPFEIVEYLINPPTETELMGLLKLLGKRPLEIIRRHEPIFEEQFKGKTLSDAAWIKIIVENPILLERPIVLLDGKAWIARNDHSLDEIESALRK